MPHPRPLAVYNLLSSLVAATCDELALGPLGCPPRTCVVNGGAVAADDCCAGQLWGRWESSYLSDGKVFPGRVASELRCVGSLLLAVELAVGILRCAPVVDDNGTSPSCAELDQSAQELHYDASAILYAVTQHLETNDVQWAFRSQTPMSAEGGCVGSELHFTVALSACLTG